jgi:hypothetical protein
MHSTLRAPLKADSPGVPESAVQVAQPVAP